MRSIIGRVSNDELQDVVQALLHHFLPPDCEVTIGVFPDLA